MTPIDWAKRPIEKYADFSGRASRPEFWWYVLAVIVAGIVISIVESIVGIGHMVAGLWGPLTILLWLATIVPSFAVGIRRLHDSNRSGWWMLLILPYFISALLMGAAVSSGSMAGLASGGLVAIVGLICAIVLLVFMILPGTPGENRFGPKMSAEADAVTV